MAYASVINEDGTFVFEAKEEYDLWIKLNDLRKLNEKEYARQHKSEKIRYVYHGGCISCITPFHYGIGNCLGCMYFEADWGKPCLKIEDFGK